MPHHKRRRPKNRRAGCLMCKPQKANGAKTNGRDSLRPIPERRVAEPVGTRPLLDVAERDGLHPAEGELIDHDAAASDGRPCPTCGEDPAT